ncbi:DUF6233 domain-containing protein [Streptomyces lavendulae]|uniref:DUF6233 domain-containing protein n=1 Tax=Streptomyces lavendulae TaxID=1914 RepID=UPI0036B6F2BA
MPRYPRVTPGTVGSVRSVAHVRTTTGQHPVPGPPALPGTRPGPGPPAHPRLDSPPKNSSSPPRANACPNRPRPSSSSSTASNRPPARPARVHTGQCWDTRTRCKPATADQARSALTAGVSACPHCRPDTALGILE